MYEIREFAESFYAEKQRPPSTAEIADAFHINKSTVYRYLVEMDQIGMLSYQDGEISTGNIQKQDYDQVGIPIAGVIPCGPPSEQQEVIEKYIALPRVLLGSGEFFILRASGDSMVDAGIDSGDLVVVRRQYEAQPGKIVAALVDNESTLKRLDYDADGERLVLYPENAEKNYPVIRSDKFSIQGVAVQVLKAL